MPSPRRQISTGSPFEETMGYSRAIVQGDWCFVSGVTGYDYSTMKMPVSVARQAANCFATIGSVLSEAGFSLSDIARVQYTVVRRELVPEIQPVLQQYLGGVRPAATMVIADLIEEEMLIEIEVTAYRG
ncbi:MAG: RidA family protein [Pseudomonadota bacterium]